MAKAGKSSTAGKASGKRHAGGRAASGAANGRFAGGGSGVRAQADDDAGFLLAARFCVDDLIDVDAVSKELHLTKAMLAQAAGLSEETLQRFSRASAPKTQARLRDLLGILMRAAPFAGGLVQAFGWYRGQGIPALGDETAEALVRTGRADLVRRYLDTYAAGGYA
ncbi:MAG TPA: XRE family transcriptional regulator [Hyphomicrobiales bacterium]|nr:XRE family transcriptional regulator [Kaistiaceae bacterium]HQF31240.1 XRE family transcriptional regulator [Hyphomicrobiales bacterium]